MEIHNCVGRSFFCLLYIWGFSHHFGNMGMQHFVLVTLYTNRDIIAKRFNISPEVLCLYDKVILANLLRNSFSIRNPWTLLRIAVCAFRSLFSTCMFEAVGGCRAYEPWGTFWSFFARHGFEQLLLCDDCMDNARCLHLGIALVLEIAHEVGSYARGAVVLNCELWPSFLCHSWVTVQKPCMCMERGVGGIWVPVSIRVWVIYVLTNDAYYGSRFKTRKYLGPGRYSSNHSLSSVAAL